MRLINRVPGRLAAAGLALLPFMLLLVIYLMASQARLAENPNDKLLPGLSQMGSAVERMSCSGRTLPPVSSAWPLAWALPPAWR